MVEDVNWFESAADAENLQEHDALFPFLGEGEDDEFIGYDSQAEQAWEGEENRESQHLAEHALLAFFLVVDRGEHGLRHLGYRHVDERVGFAVPVVRLREVADRADGVEASENECQYVLTQRVDNHRDENLVAEAEHPFHGLEVDVERGMPGGVIQPADEYDDVVDNLLPRKAPIAISLEGECHADASGDEQCRDADDGFFAVHQVLGEIRPVGDADRGDDESQEQDPCEGGECRLGEIVGDERGTEKEDDIERDAGKDVEPKHRVEVLLARLFLVDERHGKAAVLDVSCHCREDSQQSDDAVVVGREQPSEHDAEKNVQHLHAATVDGTPKQSFCRFLFQRFAHIIYIIMCVFYKVLQR